MIGKTWLWAGVAAILSGGCIAPGYEGVKLAREAGPTCHVPQAERNQVYLFAVTGNTPAETQALDKFCDGISAGGYAKVASGPSVYAGWMLDEMRRIHRENTRAVFVVAGLDSAAALGVKMVEKALAVGIPIQGVVVVDAKDRTPPPNYGIPTLMVGTGAAAPGRWNVESLAVPAPGKLGLPAEIRTIEQVVQLLNEIAIHNPAPSPPISEGEVAYPFAADVLLTVEPKTDSEWSFLFDQPGGVTRAIDEPLPPRTTPTRDNTANRN